MAYLPVRRPSNAGQRQSFRQEANYSGRGRTFQQSSENSGRCRGSRGQQEQQRRKGKRQRQDCRVAGNGGHHDRKKPELYILQHLRASSLARRLSAAVPPHRGHLHWGQARMMYFTAPARLQPCSPAFRGSPATQGPPPLGRGHNGVFYRTCAPPAMLAGIPRQSWQTGATCTG